MKLQMNLSDPAETIGWRILAAPYIDEEVHQVLADAQSAYRAAHPDHDPEMAVAFVHFCTEKLKAAASRISARHEFFCGMQIGGSA